ncbi:MAG: glycosyltransferase, partial [Pseudomonadota bacterium]
MTARPMKAIVLVKRFPKLSETFILNEILALETAGISLSIRYLQPPSDEIVHPDVSLVRAKAAPLGAGKLLSFFRRRPFSSLRVVLDALLSHGVGALTLCRQAASLAGAAQSDDADIIYAHFIDRPAAIARLASRLSGIPFAISAHAKDIYTTPPATLRRHLEAAAFTTTCSDQNAAYLKNIAPKAEIVRHYHGIDPATFAGARTPAGERAPLILSVGRLREKKGFNTLVAACGLLRARGVAFRCAIAGYGPEEASLRRQIAAAQLESFVLLTGKQPHQEIVRLMRDAAVFALPCRIDADGDRDGVPNVILEAMASGLPVVSTKISGVPEAVIHEETGLLVEPDDPAALAASLERFLRDPKLAGEFGERARARAVNAFASSANLPGLIADLRRRRRRRAVEVAYIVKGFPRLSESFITNEILVLESEGLSLSVYALKRGEKIAASAIRDMTGNVVYLPSLSSL